MDTAQIYEDPIFGDFFRTIRSYKTHLISIFLITFITVCGYTYYQDSLESYNERAMDYYIQYVDAHDAQDLSTESSTLALLKKSYATHLYTSLATLSSSLKHIENQQWDQAQTELKWVITHAPSTFFKDLAHYKLAEIAKRQHLNDELMYHVNQMQSPDIKALGQHVLAQSLAEEGLFEDSLKTYKTLLELNEDPIYRALLTNEYHVVSLLDS